MLLTDVVRKGLETPTIGYVNLEVRGRSRFCGVQGLYNLETVFEREHIN